MSAFRRHLADRSLLTRFGLVTLVLLSVLGLALGVAVSRMATSRAVEDVQVTAQLAAGVMTSPGTGQWSLPAPPDWVQRARLDSIVEAGFNGREGRRVTRVRVVDADRTVVYADPPAAADARVPVQVLEEVMAGASPWRMVEDTAGLERAGLDPAGGGQVRVWVPVARDGVSLGALEVVVPYAPIAASVGRDVRISTVALALGLLLFWLALLPLVSRASQRLQYQATHDLLTGLPNRNRFLARLESALVDARRDSTQVAVLLMDLDLFKQVNDTLGHHHGDVLLQQIGRRLAESAGDAHVVARLGGDEFALVVGHLHGEAAAVEEAERILAFLRRPFSVAGHMLDVRASMGIALSGQHGDGEPDPLCAAGSAGPGPELLLQRADVAMYVAKERGLGCAVYRATDDPNSPTRLGMLRELRLGIARDELVCEYQPKVELAGGRVVGVEALVRWQHPRLGMLQPASFIPLAEQSDLMRPLTRAVIDAALRQCCDWWERGIDLPVAVNLSPRDVADPELPQLVEHALRRYRLPASSLELEITETLLMSDPVHAREVLGALRELGVRTSIDDFGTGYASLAYLAQLPVDHIKIDRAFVRGLDSVSEVPPSEDADRSAAAIVRFSVDLAHSLGLTTIAEGVEDARGMARLAELGCDMAQGFYLSRPIPGDRIPDWLTTWHARRTPSSSGLSDTG